MSEILRKWLNTRLGIIVDYDLNAFENIAQDGTLLAEILFNYGIINSDLLSKIEKTYDFAVAYRNLLHLKQPLKFIGMHCNDKFLRNIAQKDKTAAVKLFYQLYVILNTKTKLNYIVTKCMDEGFPCKLEEKKSEKPYNACETNDLSVSHYVNDTRNVLKWHQNKYTELTEKSKYVREEYGKKLQQKLKNIETEKKKKRIQIDDNKNQLFIIKKPLKHISKFSLKQPDISLTIDNDGHCLPDKNKAKQYIKYLQDKHHKQMESKVIQRHINKLLLKNLLKKLIEKEDNEFKQTITEKLLKQSCYEKQMAIKLIEVRQQKEIALENLKNQHIEINKKREQEFIDKLFQQKTNLTYSEKKFIENKKRQYELHKRLWAEKKKQEYKEDYKTCENIMYDIMDLAIKSVEYRKEFGLETPKNVWQEWVSLFKSEQPIYNIATNIIDVIDNIDEMEEPLTMELYRQHRLDEEDYADYINTYGMWNLELPLQFYEENFEAINLGLNVLGFVIHRLLLLKYPLPEPPVVPILPPADVRACTSGINNHEILPILQNALAKKQILVLEMQTVINFFLTAYKDENISDIDTVLKQETEKASIKEKPSKGKKDKAQKNKKKGEKQTSKGKESVIEKIPKETQTPKLFPGEECNLSKSAELGKYAYETLNLGLEINDYLMITMLTEYLKQITYIKGWVLINFPETVSEAYMLEEVLNGIKIPDSFKSETKQNVGYDLTNRDDIFKIPPDEYITIRQSSLLPNPKPSPENKYKSFFTSFVHLNFATDIEQPENQIINSTNDLINFYEKLSINNSFSFQKFDNELIRDLVKYITRDEVFANQIYDEVIANALAIKEKKMREVEEANAENNKKAKKGKKDKKSKKDSPKEQKRSTIKSLVTVIEPEVKEEIIIPPKPGEENWEYIQLPLSTEFSRILATTWQDLEEIYKNDFKELFFYKRYYANQIIPYVHEISVNMQCFIERPDNKQEYLHNFQKLYNLIDKDLREDDEFKAELHYRLSEFRNKLWSICDSRMKESEEERLKIILEHWFSNHSGFVTNVYIRAAQFELDRCVNSLQILQDYYSTMATYKPLESKLPRVNLDKFEVSDGKQGSKSDKALDLVAAMLINPNKTTENNPFISYLHTQHQAASANIKSCLNNSLFSIKTIESSFTKKAGKIKAKKKQTEVSLTENDIMIRNKIDQIIQEWNCAIEGEILRTNFRLKLIIEKAVEDINNNLQYAEKLFHDIYDQIQERYNEEVESVDAVCQIFARAIEACEPVQLKLVLDGAKFHIEPNALYYPDAPFTYDTVKERITDNDFSVAQLNMLTNIFLDLAPSGHLPQMSFIYLLQDMIVLNTEGDCEMYLPQYWYKLKINDVSKFVQDLYGQSDYVDWKDFIIWNLLLPYPTEYELLEVRRQFRQMDPDKLEYVNYQQFFSVNFWFEEEFLDEQDLCRMNLIKDLLCKLFKVAKDQINYTALLLYFCKDVDCIRGVIKAFELAVGNLVCWDVGTGSKFVEMLRKQNELKEKHNKEVMSTVGSIMGDIIEKTLETFESENSYQEILDNQSAETIEHETNEESQTYLFEEYEEIVDSVSGIPSLCYFLCYPVLLKVMTASFPWHSQVPCIEDNSFRKELENIYNSCCRKEFDNQVFMHDFLNDEQFIDLINKTTKFLDRVPSDIVKNFVDVCICENKQ